MFSKWSEAIYETCDWKNDKMTLQMTENFETTSGVEGGLCTVCSSQGPTLSKIPTGQISDTCFLMSAVSRKSRIPTSGKNSPYYLSCSDENSRAKPVFKAYDPQRSRERTLYTRALCLHRDYITMTSRAFHKMARCFGFNPKEQKNLFKLFNHESGFLLNARSPTGAKCYGQLTNALISDIVRDLYYKDKDEESHKEGYSYARAFEEAQKQCPQLDNLVYPKDFRSLSRRNFLSRTRASRIPVCQVAHNPEKCFFYSMMNVKTKLNALRRKLRTSTYPPDKRLPISDAFKEKFQTPILLNEMRKVTGAWTNKRGQSSRVNWLIWSDLEVGALTKNQSSSQEKATIEKVQVFDPEEILWPTVYWSYNAGQVVTKNYMENFLEEFTKNLSSRNCVSAASRLSPQLRQHMAQNCKSYRASLLKGETLRGEEFKKAFSIYVKEKYSLVLEGTQSQRQQRLNEVYNFAFRVERDATSLGKETSALKRRMKKFLNMDEKQARRLFDDYKEQCL